MKKNNLINHYQSLLSRHGPSPQAVQWSDEETQIKRFEILEKVASPVTSVLDVGCGLGGFYKYLRQKNNKSRYLGVDIVPEFISIVDDALKSDKLADAKLILPEEELPKGYDYAILSGVFNNLTENNWGFMKHLLRRMFDVANKGIAFNAMSSYVDYKASDLFYVEPEKVITFCKSELGGHPILRHDYVLGKGGFPYEFAVYLYKEPNF